MPNDSHRPDVAVFIDFENVYVSVRDKLDANPNFEMIMDRCEDFGRVVIARAYADWYRYPRVTSALYANGIEPMYVPTYYYDRELGRTGRAIKNSVDMNLCIDAMKTLFTNTNIAKFVLATGDRDFIPLVNSIRQQGKEVIIIGIGGAASAHLAQSADEFIFYESLIGKKASQLQQDLPKAKMPEKGREYESDEEEPTPQRGRDRERGEREREQPRERSERSEREQPREPEPVAAETNGQPDIYDTLVNAINLARERGYVCSFGSLKLLIKELMGGDFKEGKYKDASGRPFAKFKDFVLEAERRGKVQVFTRGTVNEVFLPGEDPYKLSQFAQEIKEEPSSPVTPVSEVEVRPETRPSVVSNGRRRRRRSRGGQRGAVAPGQNGLEMLDDEGDSFDELAENEAAEPALADDAEELADTAEAPVEDSAEVFEELREQAEAEAEQIDQAIAFDPTGEELMPPEPPADESLVTPSASELVASAPPTAQPFTDDEWQVLRQTIATFARPASFAQIHDALRNARNTAGITRTNEELRSLIKQAINSGLLERLGKGNRATYQLAQVPAEDAATEAPDQAEQIAPTVEDAPADEQPTPEVLPVAEDVPAPEVLSAPDQAEQIAPAEAASEPAKPARSRPRRKPAAEAAPAEAASEPAKPARNRRKKAEPAAEAAPAETPAKPARSRRKKADTPPTE